MFIRNVKDNRYITRIGFGLALFLEVLLHFLKPEFNPMTRHLSEYANGNFGFLMIVFFLSLAAGFVGMSFQAYSIITHRFQRALCSYLFMFCAFTAVVLAIFPMNLQGTPSTNISYIHHQTGPMFVIAEIIAMTVFTFRLRKERQYKPHFWPSLAFAVFMYVVFILFVLLFRSPEYIGLTERMMSFAMWMWLMNASFRIT